MPQVTASLWVIIVVSLLIIAPTRESLAAGGDGSPMTANRRVGVIAPVGVQEQRQEVPQLRITRPGVYEGLLIDGRWSEERLVRIAADDVVLRRCEIRNGRQNAIEVYADNVLIEQCHIHHILRGTFKDPQDAHGITGRPRRLVVRNCEIHHVSGDAIQFDPDRQAWNDVLIENCTLWTGPLAADAAGYRRGERPGENAIDTKSDPRHTRSRLVIRNCLFLGWGEGQITNQAALNLKEHVDVTVENCVFRENDICFRLRGDTGRGNADVRIQRCALYESNIGIRAEDRVAKLHIDGWGIGAGVGRALQFDRNRIGLGFTLRHEFKAAPYEWVLLHGVEPESKDSP